MRSMLRRTTSLIAVAALGAAVALSPIAIDVDEHGVPTLAAWEALAKDGDSDSDSGGDSDSDDGDRDDDDRDDDDDEDDRDDDEDDRDDDEDDRDDDERDDDDRGPKAEINGANIEVTYADGVKEEIENGRLQVKDASGETIVERAATADDVARLSVAAESLDAASRDEAQGDVVKAERNGLNFEVIYSTGWKEEVEFGRYELKAPNGETVIERDANAADISRISSLF